MRSYHATRSNLFVPSLRNACVRRNRRNRFLVRSEGSGNESEPTFEEQFAKELKRRKDLGKEESETSSSLPRVARKNELGGQLERSRALQSEGIEGLPRRGNDLLRLGIVSTLAFAPAAGVLASAFLLAYLIFGDAFVHGGEPIEGPTTQLVPEELLNEPTYDRYVPLARTEYYAP